MKNHIQAVLFDINKFNENEAMKWLNKKGYKPIKKVHKTDNFLRDYKKYDYRIIKNPDVSFIYGYSK